uniref:Glycosyltransferase n=1 Tax=Ananas comosus var. bracteatus TaxID=296719 RepID=A0A6V7QQ61_ANACO
MEDGVTERGDSEGRFKPHFLIVMYPVQGHINPARRLARRLIHVGAAAHVTLSTSVSGHRRMFPCSSSDDDEVTDGPISFIPFSDGNDEGADPGAPDARRRFAQTRSVGSQTLSSILDRLAARGRRVTCVLYTILLHWAADVARPRGIPSALCWIQPATVLAALHRFFHGHEGLVAAHARDPMHAVSFPGLPPLRIRDLPSFLTSEDDDTQAALLESFGEVFETLDREGPRPRVLVNTCEASEGDALGALEAELELYAVGPLVPALLPAQEVKDARSEADLFAPDEKGYMEWLDAQEARSVVYVSFGSLVVMKKKQAEEMLMGLRESGRPYLWVVRRDSRGSTEQEEECSGTEEEDEEAAAAAAGGGGAGMVVEWCDQLEVLAHRAVGCFVTHCGWNSVLESLACGVPAVGAPQWADQGTNARLVEEVWGTGLRGRWTRKGCCGARS